MRPSILVRGTTPYFTFCQDLCTLYSANFLVFICRVYVRLFKKQLVLNMHLLNAVMLMLLLGIAVVEMALNVSVVFCHQF
jgi:hypothetical protein